MDSYELQDELGFGYSAVVRRAVHRETGAVRAIKIIDKSKVSSRMVLCEADLMSKIKHPNVIELIDVYETDKTLCLVMEYNMKMKNEK